MQVILELVLGMDKERLMPELLERCHVAFEVLDEHLFSFPINLPGFGETTLLCMRLFSSIPCVDPSAHSEQACALQGECRLHAHLRAMQDSGRECRPEKYWQTLPR